MAKYIELTNDNFDATTNNGVSLIDFWAPWCGPCRMMAPTIEELAEDFDGQASICKINADTQQDLLSKFGIKSVPTIILMKHGEPLETIQGACSKNKLTDAINALLID
ncbi:thioredoxin [Sinobacterium caligoides]|uniref:Thioredoxin n=1 Tax=Sinobacterium caligoides TaxID=933926 RepID=A0A3N2E1Y9_9GAMM|nr:thioredoxin [Sinobacterium caligoides]ROS05585.1 thioredoxin [Sinobacterium caligoides]